MGDSVSLLSVVVLCGLLIDFFDEQSHVDLFDVVVVNKWENSNTVYHIRANVDI